MDHELANYINNVACKKTQTSPVLYGAALCTFVQFRSSPLVKEQDPAAFFGALLFNYDSLCDDTYISTCIPLEFRPNLPFPVGSL